MNDLSCTVCAPWSSGYSGLVMVQKVAVKHEFEAGFCHVTTRKTLSVNQAVNGYLFRIRKG